MSSKFLYPIDIDQFERIRETGKFYVDKTDMLFDLVNKYDYVFLSRPRRFGKSLLCNTFKAYFEGRKDLFEGLKIASLEKEWKRYPVLKFAMSGLKNLNLENAREKLGYFIEDYEVLYGINNAGKTPGTRFRSLIHTAHAKTGEKVVALIDEYDAPILYLLLKPEERDAMRRMINEFFDVLKDEGEHIRFVFMTGITKFTVASIFSCLNNLYDISMRPDYAGICGITKTELETTFRPDVEDFAKRLGYTVEEAYGKLKEYYGGYCFCENREEVYAPFSVFNALNDGEVKDYWFKSAAPSYLIESMRHYQITLPLKYNGLWVSERCFYDSCIDAEEALPLLYQTGYLSIESYNKEMDTYTLHFPNKEVRNSMENNLMPRCFNAQLDNNGQPTADA